MFGGSKKFRVHWKGGLKSLGYVEGGSKKFKVKQEGGLKKFSRTKIEIFQPPTKVFMNGP